jgi:hypothetical protein
MNPKIIDLLNPELKKNIELLHCLQADKNYEDKYYFSPDNWRMHLKMATKITRLSSNFSRLEFDLIETEINGDKNIFLGHWNNGTV